MTGAAQSHAVVPLGEDRRADLLDVDVWAFTDLGDPETATLGFEWDRTAGVEVDGTLAGVHTVYSLATTVPGGVLPTAALSWVGVHPQFRRRGVLGAMMRHHLAAVRERGTEPISALWAAEPAIYGRFGYGAATTGVRLTLPRGAALVDVPGTDALTVRFETADPERFGDLVDACHVAAAALRPGMVTRESPGLRRQRLVDQPLARGRTAEPLRLLLVEDAAGALRPYAAFTRTAAWTDTGPDGKVDVQEAVALDPAAARVLWGRLTDLDLSTSVRTDSRPHDDPLLHQLVDLRAAAPRVADGTWLRVVDLPAAIGARVGSGPLDLVVEVDDVLCPWNAGRWRLAGGTDGLEAARTDDAAHVRLPVSALGSLLLGGHTLVALAAAGRVEVLDPAPLAAASLALSWQVPPHCTWVF